MSLSAGTRLGAYHVTAQIGEGGPASVRASRMRELRRGLAAAQARTRC
jgi:hypothetical protein